MSKEIVIVLKNGKTVAGDEYIYNHVSKRFELHDSTSVAGTFLPEEIKEIKTGKISKNSMDREEDR